jgi:hypothetical protein
MTTKSTTKVFKEIDMENKRRFFIFAFFWLAIFLLLNACSWFDDDSGGGSGNGGNGGSSVSVAVSPPSVTLAKGTAQQFTAEVTGSYSSGVTWSVEGNSSTTTTISRDGLLSVAGNENAKTLTVKATWSSYSDSASGTATVTIATEAEIPSNLTIARPNKTVLNLSWGAVSNAANYKLYRSTNGKDYSHLGDTQSASYNDTAVAPGSSYYYVVSAVVNGLETGRSAAVFGFAEDYFALPVFADRRLIPLVGDQKHYYRFPVTSGESYTITWENGSSGNADYYVRCAAWQNDGTQVFSDQNNGYTSPKVFTAAMSGYVTVEVRNAHSAYRYDYMAYCLRTNGQNDTGVVALPPVPVTGIKVTGPSASNITLAWDSVSGAVRYNIYRSPTKDAALGLMGSSDTANYTDSNVAPNTAYYYAIAPVNADGKEGVRVQGAFAYAASHYPLQPYSSSNLVSLLGDAKHYYRLAVTAGQDITITWENGSSQNADYYVRCAAWQNDGTQVFSDQINGYTSPRVFTVATSGFVTIEVRNAHSSTSYDYKIYY